MLEESNAAEIPLIRDISEADSRSPSRVRLVGNQEEFDDREGYDDQGTRPDYGDGCFTDGMGSSLQRCKDRRPVVPVREQEPHQLSRTPGSYVCSEVVCQGQEGQPHPSQNGQQNRSILCQSHGGGTRSPALSRLATQLWQWCLERNISLTAEHLPGTDNYIADKESRTIQSSAEWQLHQGVFRQILGSLGRCNIDLFATRLNAQLEQYVSWRPDPNAVGTDVLQLPWDRWEGYAFPPFCLIGRCLRKI